MKRRTLILIVTGAMLVGLAAIAADEITASWFLKVNNGAFDFTRNVPNLRRDQRGTAMTAGIQSIQTGAWEQITIPADLATNGYAVFRNVTTNAGYWIDIGTVFRGVGTTGWVAQTRLYGSDAAMMRLHPTNGIFATAGATSGATTAGVNLEYWINAD